MPKRIQRQRTAGWRMPEGAIYVGRPTRWGNPYRWNTIPAIKYDEAGEPFRVPDDARRRWAVTDFKAALDPEYGWSLHGYPTREEIRAELRGKDLACWCPPGQPCHADVLLEIANSLESAS